MHPTQEQLRTTRPRRGGRLLRSLAVLVTLGTIAACGGNSGGTEVAENKISVGEVPNYYPDDYSALIEKAKSEGGELVIYSNTSETNWAPVFRDFKKKYPWVTSVSANNLDSDEVFQRALSEQATGDSPVDLVVSNAANAWAKFAGREGTLMAYESPEVSKLPDFAEVLPNVYTMSADPMLLIYNTQLMEQKPTGVAHLAEIVAADPEKFTEKIEIRDPESSFGFTVNHSFAEATDHAWSAFETILPVARPETSSGTMAEKILSGEYLAGFFISGSAFPIVEKSAGLVEAVYPDDGTIVLPRGIGIAAGAPHPATAKLFIDFVMSAEGQRAVAEGGLSSYREGISGEGLHTYQEIVDQVGEENVIFVEYEAVPQSVVKQFQQRFYALLNQ